MSILSFSIAFGLILVPNARVNGVPVNLNRNEVTSAQSWTNSSENSEDVSSLASVLPITTETPEVPNLKQNITTPRADDSLKPSEKRAFIDVMVGICEKVYPDLRTYSGTDTPFLDSNCSILCVYGKPEVAIPDGSPCYLKINYVGTPGTCSNGECIIPGKPFEFHPSQKDFPLLYTMFDPIMDP